jgi:hypothetical protein
LCRHLDAQWLLCPAWSCHAGGAFPTASFADAILGLTKAEESPLLRSGGRSRSRTALIEKPAPMGAVTDVLLIAEHTD